MPLKAVTNARLTARSAALDCWCDRGRLTLFVQYPEIEPTNNRAERGLRPAVIARKVSHCAKNQRGAKTCAVIKTILTTLALRATEAIRSFVELLRGKSLAAACGRSSMTP
jgi:hypothetical protein